MKLKVLGCLLFFVATKKVLASAPERVLLLFLATRENRNPLKKEQIWWMVWVVGSPSYYNVGIY